VVALVLRRGGAPPAPAGAVRAAGEGRGSLGHPRHCTQPIHAQRIPIAILFVRPSRYGRRSRVLRPAGERDCKLEPRSGDRHGRGRGAWHPDRWRRIWIPAEPVALYGLWFPSVQAPRRLSGPSRLSAEPRLCLRRRAGGGWGAARSLDWEPRRSHRWVQLRFSSIGRGGVAWSGSGAC
jgi:hypothetical protein